MSRVQIFWDNTQISNTYVIRDPKWKKKGCYVEKIFEIIMTRNTPKLLKQINIQIQETLPNLKWINLNNSTSKSFIIKMLKTKVTKISCGENQCSHKGK